MRSRGAYFYGKDIDVPTRARSLALGIITALTLASPLAAQLPIPRPAIVGGVSLYDLGDDGVGQQSTGIAALRVDIPLLLITAEGSLGVFRPKVDGETRTYIIPEVQAQYQLFPAIVRPYLGLGIGMLNPISGGGSAEATYSASAGIRVGLPVLPIGFRGEARVRAGNGLKRQATELTIGISW
jgi:hypothetical protein